ncbi:MAG: FixH family protein [Gammaproteobacteria bacterium]|nr:FixH family protein [Gammaproteobacteria bacterium]
MPDLLTSLGIGVVAAIAGFIIFYKFIRFSAAKSGFLSAALVLGVYITLAIIFWPGGDVFAIHLAIFAVVPYMMGMISHYREQALDSEQRKKWFHWIPALFFAFFFVVVVVNMTLVSLSTKGMSPQMLQWLLPKQNGGQYTSQFPGVISHDYQEKEALYNEYLKNLERQKQRGWKIKQGWLVSPEQNKPAIFQIEARDKNGHIISGLNISLKFLRPSNFHHDKTFTMQEVLDGIYQQSIVFEWPGNWDVVIMMTKDGEVHEIRGDSFVKDQAAK